MPFASIYMTTMPSHGMAGAAIRPGFPATDSGGRRKPSRELPTMPASAAASGGRSGARLLRPASRPSNVEKGWRWLRTRGYSMEASACFAFQWMVNQAPVRSGGPLRDGIREEALEQRSRDTRGAKNYREGVERVTRWEIVLAGPDHVPRYRVPEGSGRDPGGGAISVLGRRSTGLHRGGDSPPEGHLACRSDWLRLRTGVVGPVDTSGRCGLQRDRRGVPSSRFGHDSVTRRDGIQDVADTPTGRGCA